MSDVQLANVGQGFDLVIVNGDVVLLDEFDDDQAAVAQRLTYRLMTFLGESVYEVTAGVPYLETVFGFEPVDGVSGLLLQVILETEGVSSLLDEPTFVLDGRELVVTVAVLTTQGAELRLQLGVDPS